MSDTKGNIPSKNQSIKVLIVDDQRSIRTAYELIINSFPQLEVVGTIADGQAAQSWIEKHKNSEKLPDVILMDIRMPNCDGIQATRVIKNIAPDIKILGLTTFDQDHFAFGILEAGASGFLLKGLRREQMAAAIFATARGDAVITPRITRELLHRHLKQQQNLKETAKQFEILTRQEIEVVKLIAEGMNNAEIAATLHIEPDSAKKAVSRILAKTGLRDRLQLAIAYHRTLQV